MSVRWFTAVRGHDRARTVLARGLETGRIPPTLVLAGQPGVGRALLARELAKALNCKGEAASALPHAAGLSVTAGRSRPLASLDGQVPCNACAACRKVDHGTHPDVVTIVPEDGKAALSIDQVRAAVDEMTLAPVEGRRRVFVFDPADALTEDAQNALLKLLEEPPARTHVILIARHEDALLRTIASRSFVLALGELSPEDVSALLEARGVPHAEAIERAAWALGSPGLALREGHLERVADAKRLLESWASGAARRDPLGVANELIGHAAPRTQEPQERRDGALEVVSLVSRALRDALDRAVRGEESVRLSGTDSPLLDRLARAGREGLLAAGAACARAEEAILANHNVNLALEGLVLDVVRGLDVAQGLQVVNGPGVAQGASALAERGSASRAPGAGGR